jgi:uncharacterized protein (TIGR02001 family)
LSAHRDAGSLRGPSSTLPAEPGRQRPGACNLVLAALGLLAIGLSLPLRAQTAPLGGTLALTSQLVDRGLAITPATPVAQGELRWSSPAGWSLDVVAASELRSPQLAVAMVQVARAWPVAENWQVQGSLLYYDSPRRGWARAYRRAEANMTFIYRDVLTLNLSALHPLGVEDAHTNVAADANLRWPLTRHLSLAAGAGVARFQYGYGYHGETHAGYYSYGQVGLVWAAGRWRAELDRIATDGAPPSRRGSGGLSPWLASVSWSF